jgi:alpha-1,2-mannosyltransferase
MNREGGRNPVRAIFGQGPADAITRLPVLLILWWLAILHTLILAVNLPQRAYHNDFSVFYASAIAFRHGLDPYTANLMPIGQRLGMHIGSLIHSTDTPTALLFFMPISLATPPAAHTIWIALNGAAMVAALILLIRPKYSGLDTRMAFAIAALALLYAPVTENFLFSQRQSLILLLLVIVMRALDKGREAAAGLLLGLAGAYRAFPLLIAGYFVIRRQWRPLAFMGVGLAIVGAVTIAGLGMPVCVSYLHGMRFALTAFTLDPADVALRAFLIRLFSYVAGFDLNSRLRLLQHITIAFAQIVIIALAAWPTYQRGQQTGFDRRAYGLWVAAAILLSPLSWIHYMILLLIPFAELASAAERQKCSRRAVWAAIASYALIAMTYHLREDLVGAIWWARGIRFIAEGSFIALLLGFVAAYWFASDGTDSATARRNEFLA